MVFPLTAAPRSGRPELFCLYGLLLWCGFCRYKNIKKSLLKAFCLLGIVFVSPSLSSQESEGFSWVKSIFNKDDSDQNKKTELNFAEVSERMKITFENIKSKRNESQIRDNKSFGKLVADDEQLRRSENHSGQLLTTKPRDLSNSLNPLMVPLKIIKKI